MKTVYMCFATDVIHEGHMNVVKKAKEYGKVVAGVLCDAEMVRYNRFPTVSFEERMAMVKNIPEIDEVIVQDRIMYDNVIKELKPDYVIPFKLDKKAAKEAYYKHLTGKAFIPSVFRQENHIDEIVGLYVPFWVFNIESEADISYDAEKIRVWKSGDTEYTEHKYYKIRRGGTIYFEHVPEDGSVKMDDALMESLEPYDFKDAVPFKAAYLAGYVADRYDVDQDECMKRAKKRIRRSTEDSFRETVNGYYALSTQSSTVNIRDSKTSYAMYPVWLLNTTWKGQKYTFAMNGQSGKIVGDLPADEGAFWKYVGTRGILISVILYIIMMVVMFL